MSSPTLQFPSADEMTKCLSNYAPLNLDYFKEKGLTQTIIKLSVDRFANSDTVPMGIELGTMLMVNDLREGTDGFSGAALPKINLPPMVWAQLSMSIKDGLTRCAKPIEKAQESKI